MNVTLTTTGRKTGQPRTVPLYAFEDGDRLVIVGSWAGKPTDPAWVLNLRADPHATVVRGREAQEVRSSEVKGRRERERLWQLVTAAFPLYQTYQRRTSRTIPLFVLEPLQTA